MDYPLQTQEEKQVGFNIFGTPEFQDKIQAAIVDKTILLKEMKGKHSYNYLEVNGEHMGRAWLDTDSFQEPVFSIAQDTSVYGDVFFPWNFKELDTFLFVPDQEQSHNKMIMFQNFVCFVEGLQFELAETVKQKVPGYDEETFVPQALYPLLEFEYFREIVEVVKDIEIGLAFVEGTTGMFLYAMVLVRTDDHDLKFCSAVKLKDAGF